MALLYASALELYDAAAATALLAAESSWLVAGTPGDWSVVEDGMHSRRAIQGAGVSYLSVVAEPSSTTAVAIMQAAIKVSALSDAVTLAVWDGNGLVCDVRLAADGSLSVYGSSDQLIASTARGTVRAGTWHYIELKVMQGASGRVRLRVDGATLVDEAGAEVIGAVLPYLFRFGGASSAISWSDMMIMDGSGARCSDMLGPRTRVALLRPLANGAEADWTASPTTGGAAAALDDAVPGSSDGATTHITTSTVTHKSTVTCEPLGPEAESIEAALVVLEAEATTQGIQPIGISGSTQSAGATASLNAVGAGYRVARHTMHGNPATGGRWTRATVSALRVGGLAV